MLAALVAALVVPILPGQPTPSHVAASGGSYGFQWREGSYLTIYEYWNAPSRAGCDYASNPWPQAQLAAQRAYVLGLRQVLAYEWNISGWIAANRATTSQARVHGAETNCPDGHKDYPPHVHAFYAADNPTSSEWLMINSHYYPNGQGKIYQSFILPAACGRSGGYYAPAGQWIDILDERCTPAWQERYTASGELELRRSPTAPTYSLRIRAIGGDLASLDVLLSGQPVYTVDIVGYDALAFRMAAKTKDYRRNTLVTENWWGDPARGINLVGHTTQNSTLGASPTPAPIPFVVKSRVYLPTVTSRGGW